MNGNPKQSLWVLALGIAITGFYTSNVSAAAPARQEPGQQDWDHDRNQNPDRNDEQRGERWSFQQGVRDGQHDRQYGGNRSDHQQPSDVNDRRAYRNGYKQGFRNTAYIQRSDRRGRVNYCEEGVRDGQHDRQYGSNRYNHQQPNDANDLRAHEEGYRKGYSNSN